MASSRHAGGAHTSLGHSLSQDRNHQTGRREWGLGDVKKRLDFNADENDRDINRELDFTSKLKAFRALVTPFRHDTGRTGEDSSDRFQRASVKSDLFSYGRGTSYTEDLQRRENMSHLALGPDSLELQSRETFPRESASGVSSDYNRKANQEVFTKEYHASSHRPPINSHRSQSADPVRSSQMSRDRLAWTVMDGILKKREEKLFMENSATRRSSHQESSRGKDTFSAYSSSCDVRGGAATDDIPSRAQLFHRGHVRSADTEDYMTTDPSLHRTSTPRQIQSNIPDLEPDFLPNSALHTPTSGRSQSATPRLVQNYTTHHKEQHHSKEPTHSQDANPDRPSSKPRVKRVISRPTHSSSQRHEEEAALAHSKRLTKVDGPLARRLSGLDSPLPDRLKLSLGDGSDSPRQTNAPSYDSLHDLPRGRGDTWMRDPIQGTGPSQPIMRSVTPAEKCDHQFRQQELGRPHSSADLRYQDSLSYLGKKGVSTAEVKAFCDGCRKKLSEDIAQGSEGSRVTFYSQQQLNDFVRKTDDGISDSDVRSQLTADSNSRTRKASQLALSDEELGAYLSASLRQRPYEESLHSSRSSARFDSIRGSLEDVSRKLERVGSMENVAKLSSETAEFQSGKDLKVVKTNQGGTKDVISRSKTPNPKASKKSYDDYERSKSEVPWVTPASHLQKRRISRECHAIVEAAQSSEKFNATASNVQTNIRIKSPDLSSRKTVKESRVSQRSSSPSKRCNQSQEVQPGERKPPLPLGIKTKDATSPLKEGKKTIRRILVSRKPPSTGKEADDKKTNSPFSLNSVHKLHDEVNSRLSIDGFDTSNAEAEHFQQRGFGTSHGDGAPFEAPKVKGYGLSSDALQRTGQCSPGTHIERFSSGDEQYRSGSDLVDRGSSNSGQFWQGLAPPHVENIIQPSHLLVLQPEHGAVISLGHDGATSIHRDSSGSSTLERCSSEKVLQVNICPEDVVSAEFSGKVLQDDVVFNQPAYAPAVNLQDRNVIFGSQGKSAFTSNEGAIAVDKASASPHNQDQMNNSRNALSGNEISHDPHRAFAQKQMDEYALLNGSESLQKASSHQRNARRQNEPLPDQPDAVVDLFTSSPHNLGLPQGAPRDLPSGRQPSSAAGAFSRSASGTAISTDSCVPAAVSVSAHVHVHPGRKSLKDDCSEFSDIQGRLDELEALQDRPFPEGSASEDSSPQHRHSHVDKGTRNQTAPTSHSQQSSLSKRPSFDSDRTVATVSVSSKTSTTTGDYASEPKSSRPGPDHGTSGYVESGALTSKPPPGRRSRPVTPVRTLSPANKMWGQIDWQPRDPEQDAQNVERLSPSLTAMLNGGNGRQSPSSVKKDGNLSNGSGRMSPFGSTLAMDIEVQKSLASQEAASGSDPSLPPRPPVIQSTSQKSSIRRPSPLHEDFKNGRQSPLPNPLAVISTRGTSPLAKDRAVVVEVQGSWKRATPSPTNSSVHSEAGRLVGAHRPRTVLVRRQSSTASQGSSSVGMPIDIYLRQGQAMSGQSSSVVTSGLHSRQSSLDFQSEGAGSGSEMEYRDTRAIRTSTPVKASSIYNPLSGGNLSAVEEMVSLEAEAAAAGIEQWPTALDTIKSQLTNPSMVALLKRLYSVDGITRQQLMTKALYFRKWKMQVQIIKRHKQIHGISIKRANDFHRKTLRTRSFYLWRAAAWERRANRKADGLHKRHLLRKGLRGFHWAIYRSQHRQARLQAHVYGVRLAAAFKTWRERTADKRLKRLAATMQRWREITLEAQKMRQMQSEMNEKLLRKVFRKWNDRFHICQKQHQADDFFRAHVLQRVWVCWHSFFLTAREKRQKLERALYMESQVLLKKYLNLMRAAYEKQQIAKSHHRARMLGTMLHNWKQATVMWREERRRDNATSLARWETTTTAHHFLLWRERLNVCRATRMADRNTTRHAFQAWRQLYRDNQARYSRIKQQLQQSRLRRCMQGWHTVVQTHIARRTVAVQCLERVLLREEFMEWHQYTMFQQWLRQNMRAQLQQVQQHRLRECWDHWRHSLNTHLDEKRAHQFWSDRCVRKVVARWTTKCHKHRLRDILEESAPDRELSHLKYWFGQWLQAKAELDCEKEEAARARQHLDLCQQRWLFLQWRQALHRRSLIAPLVLRKQTLLLSQTFQAWKQLVQHKRQCRENAKAVLLLRLRSAFKRWGRQLQGMHAAASHQQSRLQRLQAEVMQEWHQVILRKRSAQSFHCAHLQAAAFRLWVSRTRSQLAHKLQTRVEKERNLQLLREYFDHWVTSARQAVQQADTAVAVMDQTQCSNRLKTAFCSWRRHLHITLLARAHMKVRDQRWLRTVLWEWKAASVHSLQSAVRTFKERLRLQSSDSEEEAGMRDEVEGGEVFGTSLTQTGLLELSVASQTLAKFQRLQGLVEEFVTRLRHWPVSLAFDQWYEFTQRQRQLRSLGEQVSASHQLRVLGQTWQQWCHHWRCSARATQHRHTVLKREVFSALQDYWSVRKMKAQRVQAAQRHHVLTTLAKVFPVWRDKFEESRRKREIIHLWTTETAAEQELRPLEAGLRGRLVRRTLEECLGVWYCRFHLATRVRAAFHRSLLSWVLSAWAEWGLERGERRRKAEALRQQRVQTQAFKLWMVRLQQKQTAEQHYKDVCTSELRLIFYTWQHWARGHRQTKVAGVLVAREHQQGQLRAKFGVWHHHTMAVRVGRLAQQRHLKARVLYAWYGAVQAKLELDRKILQFQVRCLTSKVKHMFRHWLWQLRQRKEEQMALEERRQQHALVIARRWRKLARKARGQRLEAFFNKRRVAMCLARWKVAYQHCLEREEVLAAHLVVRNQRMVADFLERWRSELRERQAARLFDARLLATAFCEWWAYVKGVRDRRVRGLALQRALQERTQHIYFRMWRESMIVSQSIREHYLLRLQIRVLRSWQSYAHHRHRLHVLEVAFTQRVNRRVLSETFATMRCKFDYCQGLNEMAAKVSRDRQQSLVRDCLLFWQGRLDALTAARCYGKFLAVRGVRQWKKFVQRRREERQRQEDLWELAVHHHHSKLRAMVVQALRTEVKVARHIKLRRQRRVRKCGLHWKLLTDLSFTARTVERETALQKFWLTWRKAYCQRAAANKVQAFHTSQLLARVFHGWRNTVTKNKWTLPLRPQPSVSGIPVPVQPPSIQRRPPLQ